MSAALFLDASGWFAAISPREAEHATARQAYSAALTGARPIVTTLLVIAEVHTLVLRWRGVTDGQRLLDAAFDPTAHTIAATDPELVEAARHRWVHGYSSQPFSLCDAVSFEVMRRERIRFALTFDRHFEIAGFETLRTR